MATAASWAAFGLWTALNTGRRWAVVLSRKLRVNFAFYPIINF